jgi:chromosome segregation ATPase
MEDKIIIEWLKCNVTGCEHYDKGGCDFYCNTSICQKRAMYEYGLALQGKPTHTPNYAEEQLEHAEQQEEKLIEILKKELEESKKISASNYDEYQEHLKLLQQELEDTKKEYLKKYKKETEDYKELLNNQSISIKEYMKENENLKEENKKLTEELESLKYQFAEVQQIIKENERKLYNYESIKGLIKILYEGL